MTSIQPDVSLFLSDCARANDDVQKHLQLAPGMTLTIDHDGNIAAQKYWDLDPSRSLTMGKSAVEAGVVNRSLQPRYGIFSVERSKNG